MIRFSVSVSDVSDEDATRKKTAPVEFQLKKLTKHDAINCFYFLYHTHSSYC